MTNDDPCYIRIGVHGDRSCPELERHVHCVRCPVFAETAHELFDRPAPPGYRAEWTELLSRPNETSTETTTGFITFRVGSEWFGLASGACVEVTDAKRAFPLAHRGGGAFEGFVNVRGQILLSVNVAALLTAERTDASSSRARLVVVEDASGRYALRVDELDKVRRIPASGLHEPPATVSRAFSSLVRSVVLPEADGDRGFAVFDEAELFAALARSVS